MTWGWLSGMSSSWFSPFRVLEAVGVKIMIDPSPPAEVGTREVMGVWMGEVPVYGAMIVVKRPPLLGRMVMAPSGFVLLGGTWM